MEVLGYPVALGSYKWCSENAGYLCKGLLCRRPHTSLFFDKPLSGLLMKQIMVLASCWFKIVQCENLDINTVAVRILLE